MKRFLKKIINEEIGIILIISVPILFFTYSKIAKNWENAEQEYFKNNQLKICIEKENIKKKEEKMDWPQVLTILGAHIAIFLWLRSETRADHKRALDLIESIKDEMKDFHGRLCAIEEKYHQLRSKQENI